MLRIVAIGVGALLAAYLLLLAVVRAFQPLNSLLARVGWALASPFSSSFGQMDQNSRKSKLESEIRRALGNEDPFGDDERRQIVAAAVASQEINIINRKLREGVGRCLQTHWSIAEGTGATNMAEAARHPLSRHLRNRVIDLSELLIERIGQYPLLLDSPELVRLHVGLRWVPATCATCPYWSSNVVDAPKICPTAKAMFGASQKSHTVIDAEVIDQCD